MNNDMNGDLESCILRYPDKYRHMIDQETWAFILRTERFYPPDTASFAIAQQRDVYDLMCQSFEVAHPANVQSKDVLATASGLSVSCRVYQHARFYSRDGTQPIVIYFHGGGFVVGGLHSHDSICAELCASTGCTLVSVDYRLSPENSHPAAFEDSVATFNWAQEYFNRPIILCGDSAGANLAAAVSHSVRGKQHALKAQVLIYPGLGGNIRQGSFVNHAHAPMLTLADIKFYESVRFREKMKQSDEESTDQAVIDQSLSDPTCSPLRDTDFANLPPTVVFAAECDPLCDDGRHYVEAIKQAGGKAKLIVEQGLVHGYLRARHSVKRAEKSFSRIVEAISAGHN